MSRGSPSGPGRTGSTSSWWALRLRSSPGSPTASAGSASPSSDRARRQRAWKGRRRSRRRSWKRPASPPPRTASSIRSSPRSPTCAPAAPGWSSRPTGWPRGRAWWCQPPSRRPRRPCGASSSTGYTERRGPGWWSRSGSRGRRRASSPSRTANASCRCLPPRTTSGSSTGISGPTPVAWARSAPRRTWTRTSSPTWSGRCCSRPSARWPGAGPRSAGRFTPG